MLVILIVVAIFLLWLGIALRKIHRGFSLFSIGAAAILLFLIVGAFFGMI